VPLSPRDYGRSIWVGQLWSWFWHGFHEELQHAYTCSWMPSCSCGHDNYLGNAPPGRLKFYGFLHQQCKQHWPKTSVRERRFSRHENQTDSDVRLGWFQHNGLAAHIPKPTCRVWSCMSVPKSFPLTRSSTSVSSGNGGEEHCCQTYYCNCGELTSTSIGEHMFTSCFSTCWTSLYVMIALICSTWLSIG
jgi:hypothetical protein